MREMSTDIVSVLAFLISACSLLLSYLAYQQSKKTVMTTIKHELINLPPYKSEKVTKIIVKNVGNALAEVCGTFLTFSWDPELTVTLDYELDENYRTSYILYPNQEEQFFRKLPQPRTSGKHEIEIITHYISSGNDILEKIDKFPIYYSEFFVTKL